MFDYPNYENILSTITVHPRLIGLHYVINGGLYAHYVDRPDVEQDKFSKIAKEMRIKVISNDL